MDYPPELSSLTACVRSILGRGSLPLGEQPKAVCLDLAERHSLMPYLAASLPILPEAVHGPIRAWDRNWTRTALAHARELARLASAFEAEDIGLLALKGPVLAKMLYGDPCRRSFSDLDLLVKPADVGRARDLLQELGYREKGTQPVAARRRKFDWYREAPLRHEARGFEADLHWDLTPKHFPARINAARVWERAEKVELCGVAIQSPQPRDYLEYLCLHGDRHGWSSLGWLADVAALMALRGGEIDLGELIATSEGGDRILGALEQSRRHFGLPADIPAIHTRRAGWLRELRYRAAVLLIPTEADWAGVDLPPALDVLYYPLRLARLAARTIATAARLVSL